MRKLLVLIVILSLTSCEYFNVKKTSSEAILKEELETFNWKDVDEYPSFSVCDSSSSKAERTLCFQTTITQHITNYLQEERIVVTQDINDTLILNFQVSNTGNLSLLEAKIDSLTYNEIPNIKELLNQSLDVLPKIFPAIKRGQQVTTEFKLPIVIHVN
ncbi:hypothetical protein FPF71_03720 [Algibacter amylolyticus]|uniref:TonB C-terminal domain-containing protein n=1 Tax=Algibacter amylolyticus TaxID=1608400 RepID=A0A5M7BGQ0_9FLAO|nr:hypothetical protein [Algibacter amylolyticus]KAA5827960.1 hypothetical protein F2B50_03720 [Algibacter amylolyticus]MBB5267196.1 hypothetical protein [Algibacter amylolyticus]TSJ82205.1 hypothetical protein FPF71_03720 [Algibacter amylolyticus]